VKNSPILTKGGISRYGRLSEHQTGRIRKETPSPCQLKHNIQNKERILKAAKEK
jgi:hypothetical protein